MVSSVSAGEICRHPAHRDIPALGGKVKQLALSPSSFFHRPNGRDFCKKKGRVEQTSRGSSPNGVVYLKHIIHIMGWAG